MKRFIAILAATAGLVSSGCLFTSATLPLSYNSPTAPVSGAGPDAHGESCAGTILGLVGFGDASYDAAYKAALTTSGASSLYDVRVDRKIFSILGPVYASWCTELTGRVAK